MDVRGLIDGAPLFRPEACPVAGHKRASGDAALMAQNISRPTARKSA
jgi:hypothetical protein